MATWSAFFAAEQEPEQEQSWHWVARVDVPAATVFAVPVLLEVDDLGAISKTIACAEPGLRERIVEAVLCTVSAATVSNEVLEEAVLAALQPMPASADSDHVRWVLPDSTLSWIRHTEFTAAPNVTVRAQPPKFQIIVGEAGIPAGTAPLINWFSDLRPTIQRAARLVARLSTRPFLWMDTGECHALEEAIRQGLCSPLPGTSIRTAAAASARVDPKAQQRLQAINSSKRHKLRLFTDYQLLLTFLQKPPCEALVELVQTSDVADVVWQHDNIRNFPSIPLTQLVMQFPYEGCLVRKDILAQTVRSVPDNARHFFPRTYDLATEVHYFWQDATSTKTADEHTPYWLVKPAQASRSAGMFLTHSPLAVVRSMEGAPDDRVVQAYITRPLLIDERKFDLRVYVLVLSFVPLEAFLFRGIYARLAQEPYQPPSASRNFNVQFTVQKYSSGKQLYRSLDDLHKAFSTWQEQMEPQICDLARALMQAAAQQIGTWPGSRSLYGLDILFDADHTPRLLECNFFPDLDQVTTYNPDFVAEVVETLLGRPGPNMIKL